MKAVCALVISLVAASISIDARFVQPGCGTWENVHTAPINGTSVAFAQIATAAPNDIWAVGDFTNGKSVQQPLAEHWNGADWSITALAPVSGGGSLTAVSAISTKDVWVAGDRNDFGRSNQSSTIAEHWNGAKWQLVRTPSLCCGGPLITALVAMSSTNVWAVGDMDNSGSLDVPISEHWNGAAWKSVEMPNKGKDGIEINGATAVAAGTIWAVGGTFTGYSGPGKAIVERWNGSKWTIGTAPRTAGVTLAAASAVSPTSVWAVGEKGSGTLTRYLTEHWNGKSWTAVPAPPGPHPQSTLVSVDMLSSTNGWAVGYSVSSKPTKFDGSIRSWNGVKWSRSSFPTKSGATLHFGVGADRAGGAWAVGVGGPARSGSALALHFTACPPAS